MVIHTYLLVWLKALNQTDYLKVSFDKLDPALGQSNRTHNTRQVIGEGWVEVKFSPQTDNITIDHVIIANQEANN